MPDVKWIKIVTDIFDDEKIKYIETTPSGDTTIVIWFRLLCLAGKSNHDGLLMMTDKIAYTDEMLSSIFNRDIKTIRMALGVFEKLEMIEIMECKIYIPKWEKHQSVGKLEVIREKTRLRVSKFRQRQIENKTDMKAPVTEVTQEKTLLKHDGNAIELDASILSDLEFHSDLEFSSKTEQRKDFTNNKKNLSVSDEWFKEFWNIYPKKVQRKTSEQKFKVNVKDELTFNAIMFDLSSRVTSNDWTKDDGQFIPNPTTYLNQRRWEDEPIYKKKSSGNYFKDLLQEEEDSKNNVIDMEGMNNE